VAPFDDAVAAYKRGDYDAALQLFRPLAEQGDAKAQRDLGRMYALGEGVTQDFVEAIKWFRRSADQGDATGQFNLGLSYENGNGVNQDYTEAAKWYRRAADQGYAKAQNALGDIYFFGDGVAEDDSEAMTWYRRAADQAFSEAQFSVGYLFENSEHLPRDLKEAAHWYQLAAEQGNAHAEFALGKLYRDGRGVPEDVQLAYKWFRRAMENSDASRRDHAVSELHSLVAALPAATVSDLPPDPFGRNLKMVWPRASIRGVFVWIIVTVLCAFGLWQFIFAKHESNEPSVSDPWHFARKAEALFWVAYILLPFFTGGWQAYNWLPNESYRPRVHTLVTSYEVCDEWGRCADRPDLWENKETGEIYTREDFAEHRHLEALRMGITWFVYGVIGCLAFAYFRNLRNPGTLPKYLRGALCANAAIAVFAIISTW
jgi:hypothetical protein